MTFRTLVERYLRAVAQQYHRGDAREESYYDVLKQLWEELGSQLSSAHATLTVLPRQTEAGNPDMRVWSGQQHVTGYIEAKEPGHPCSMLMGNSTKKNAPGHLADLKLYTSSTICQVQQNVKSTVEV